MQLFLLNDAGGHHFSLIVWRKLKMPQHALRNYDPVHIGPHASCNAVEAQITFAIPELNSLTLCWLTETPRHGPLVELTLSSLSTQGLHLHKNHACAPLCQASDGGSAALLIRPLIVQMLHQATAVSTALCKPLPRSFVKA
jgi:hypothetical protein